MKHDTPTKLSALPARTEEQSSHAPDVGGGFATLPLAGAGLESYGKKLRPAGVDFLELVEFV